MELLVEIFGAPKLQHSDWLKSVTWLKPSRMLQF